MYFISKEGGIYMLPCGCLCDGSCVGSTPASTPSPTPVLVSATSAPVMVATLAPSGDSATPSPVVAASASPVAATEQPVAAATASPISVAPTPQSEDDDFVSDPAWCDAEYGEDLVPLQIVPPQVAPAEYLGCWKDSKTASDARILQLAYLASDAMTPAVRFALNFVSVFPFFE